MKFSKLNEIPTQRDVTETFYGYDHNLKISEGSFYDMKNLCSSFYPMLAPRPKRGVYAFPTSPTPVTHTINGLIRKDALCYVDGTSFYINNSAVSGLTLTNGKKQLVSMGAYVLIFPDKKYVNTKNTTEYGNIDNSVTTTSTVTYSLCAVDGNAYSPLSTSSAEPSNPNNGDYWLDTSSTPNTLKQYSKASEVWASVATTYVKIASANIASGFAEYDGVKISGIDPLIAQLTDLNNQTSILYGVYRDTANSGAGDYIIVTGILDQVYTQTSTLTVARTMPDMDFVIESENRLWGCKYGTSGGTVVNEIYASKLGDFKNWNCFMGISTDSYVASCGTDGYWTGAITHLGYPLFFKENCLHKVYGNYPSNYQVQTTTCRGVMKGAGNSLAIVNEKLYYKSREGVCVYDGSLPSEMTSEFGGIAYSAIDTTDADTLRNGAVGGSHKSKYYISMKSEMDNTWNLFVYDADKGLWHKEDNTRATAFCSVDNEMYMASDNVIYTIFGSGTVQSAPVEWSAETGIIGISIRTGRYTTSSMPGKKYISSMLIRMDMDIESNADFYIQYDSMGEWEHIASASGINVSSHIVSIRPKRCDHLRLKLEGYGAVKVLSITKHIMQGSDY